jgi:hypothetical protein
MSAVEIHLDPRELSRKMGAMRVWLDQHRVEPSRFSCQDDDDRVLLCLEFRQPCEAEAFASQFGGRSVTDGAAALRQSLDFALPRSGMIG